MPTVFDGILHLIKAPDNTLIACYNKANYEVLNDFLKLKKKQAKACKVDKMWKNELIQTIDLIIATTHLNFAFSKECENKKFYLEKARTELLKAKSDLKKIWLIRNKYSYLDRSLHTFDETVRFIGTDSLCYNILDFENKFSAYMNSAGWGIYINHITLMIVINYFLKFLNFFHFHFCFLRILHPLA